jgi:hypothetical protein
VRHGPDHRRSALADERRGGEACDPVSQGKGLLQPQLEVGGQNIRAGVVGIGNVAGEVSQAGLMGVGIALLCAIAIRTPMQIAHASGEAWHWM